MTHDTPPPGVFSYQKQDADASEFAQVCVATHDGHTTRAYSLRLTKGARDRIQEDVVASRLVIKALAVGCGLEQQVWTPPPRPPGGTVSTPFSAVPFGRQFAWSH